MAVVNQPTAGWFSDASMTGPLTGQALILHRWSGMVASNSQGYRILPLINEAGAVSNFRISVGPTRWKTFGKRPKVCRIEQFPSLHLWQFLFK
jgi:hypothetical protein